MSRQSDSLADARLVRRVLAGDEPAFDELVRRHRESVLSVTRGVLDDWAEAEDAAQTAFIKAYGSLASFRMGSSFKTWITRIAINHCRDVLRKKKQRRFFSLDSMLETLKSLPEILVSRQSEEPGEVPSVPPGAWEALSEGERAVLDLIQDKPGISYEEISRQLGLSLDSVKGKLKRARVKLRAHRDRLNPGTERE